MKQNYLERFGQMVEALQQDTKIALLTFAIFPPMSEADLQSVERQLGFPLDEAVRSFYGQTNGLQLRWVSRTSCEWYDPAKHVFTHDPFPWSGAGDDHSEYGDEPLDPENDGCINILPLEQALFGNLIGQVIESEEEAMEYSPIRFMGRDYTGPEFWTKIRLFDGFYYFYEMAFFLDERLARPAIILGQDYRACFTDSHVSDFGSYLELILERKGAIDARPSTYNTGYRIEDAQPLLKFP